MRNLDRKDIIIEENKDNIKKLRRIEDKGNEYFDQVIKILIKSNMLLYSGGSNSLLS